MIGPLPRILEQDVIPMPLHGVNPRSIMGRAAWDVMRRKVYAKHGYRCAACGTRSRDAMFRKYLEAHELYEIDYRRQEMRLSGMEPLCHACHMFVHGGLMGMRIRSGSLSREAGRKIILHGIEVLRKSGGQVPEFAQAHCRFFRIRHDLPVKPNPPRTKWQGWRLVWDGETYPSPCRTPQDWENAMRRRNSG